VPKPFGFLSWRQRSAFRQQRTGLRRRNRCCAAERRGWSLDVLPAKPANAPKAARLRARRRAGQSSPALGAGYVRDPGIAAAEAAATKLRPGNQFRTVVAAASAAASDGSSINPAPSAGLNCPARLRARLAPPSRWGRTSNLDELQGRSELPSQVASLHQRRAARTCGRTRQQPEPPPR